MKKSRRHRLGAALLLTLLLLGSCSGKPAGRPDDSTSAATEVTTIPDSSTERMHPSGQAIDRDGALRLVQEIPANGCTEMQIFARENDFLLCGAEYQSEPNASGTGQTRLVLYALSPSGDSLKQLAQLSLQSELLAGTARMDAEGHLVIYDVTENLYRYYTDTLAPVKTVREPENCLMGELHFTEDESAAFYVDSGTDTLMRLNTATGETQTLTFEDAFLDGYTIDGLYDSGRLLVFRATDTRQDQYLTVFYDVNENKTLYTAPASYSTLHLKGNTGLYIENDSDGNRHFILFDRSNLHKMQLLYADGIDRCYDYFYDPAHQRILLQMEAVYEGTQIRTPGRLLALSLSDGKEISSVSLPTDWGEAGLFVNLRSGAPTNQNHLVGLFSPVYPEREIDHEGMGPWKPDSFRVFIWDLSVAGEAGEYTTPESPGGNSARPARR